MESLLSLVWIILGVAIGLWFVIGFLYSFSGNWCRCEDDNPTKLTREIMSLSQLGPIVIGRREAVDGYQTFLGVSFGPWLFLRRRDFGSKFLQRSGFPPEVVKQIDGHMLGRLLLRLSPDKTFLEGYFTPYRVEFEKNPPEVTSIKALQAIPRRYARVQSISVIEAESIPPALQNTPDL